MDGIIPQLSRTDKRRLENPCRRTKEGAEKIRYLIILHLQRAALQPMLREH